MRSVLAIASLATALWCVHPALARADSVEHPKVELVKKRAGASSSSDDDDAPKPTERKSSSSSSSSSSRSHERESSGGGGGGESKGLFDYIKGAFVFGSYDAPAPMKDNVIVAWLLAAFFAGLGGQVWAPMLIFKEVPDNDAKKNALYLGLIGWFFYWIPGIFPLVFPGVYLIFPLVLAVLWIVIVDGYLIPRAVMDAYSDAYRGGGGGGGGTSKRKAAKKKHHSDDDD